MHDLITLASGRFGCPVCPRRFTTIGAKKQHMKHEHPRPAR